MLAGRPGNERYAALSVASSKATASAANVLKEFLAKRDPVAMQHEG